MQDFSATLVREKLTITDQAAEEGGEAAAVVRSNRLLMQFSNLMSSETVVVRAQSMHMTLRLASKLFFSYHKNGLFSRRTEPYDWDGMWDLVQSAHDRKYAPDLWAVIYVNGKAVFRTAETPFIDVVEQCAMKTPDDYDKAVAMAEAALAKAAQSLQLEQLTKVGSIFTDDGKALRCGIIHRADSKDATFNFAATGGELYSRVPQGFNIAAAYLEAIDIRHYMRSTFRRLESGAIGKNAPEMARYYACPQRLRDLSKSLHSFEEHFDVRYRPEKPEVFKPPKEIPL